MDGAKPEVKDTATIFEDDKGQAVRLPDEYRFDTDEVTIRREGNTVVLEQVTTDQDEETNRQRYWDEVFANMGKPFSDDMVEAALNRPGLDEYHRLDCDLRLKD